MQPLLRLVRERLRKEKAVEKIKKFFENIEEKAKDRYFGNSKREINLERHSNLLITMKSLILAQDER